MTFVPLGKDVVLHESLPTVMSNQTHWLYVKATFAELMPVAVTLNGPVVLKRNGVSGEKPGQRPVRGIRRRG